MFIRFLRLEPTKRASKLIIFILLELVRHLEIKLLPIKPEPPVTNNFFSEVSEYYLSHSLVVYGLLLEIMVMKGTHHRHP